MTNWRAVVIVAAILAIIGILVMVSSPVSEFDTDTVTIPAGTGWYYYYEFDLPASGTIDVDYHETQGRPVTLTLYNRYQFERYVDGLPVGSLYVSSGSSGQFSYQVAASDTYYLVFTHGSGSTSYSQSVDVDFQLHGFDFVLFMVGLSFVIVAVALGIYGSKLKKEEQPPRTQEKKESDVVLFNR